MLTHRERSRVIGEIRFLVWASAALPQRLKPRVITCWYSHPGVSYHRPGLVADETGRVAVHNADQSSSLQRRAERIRAALDRLPDRLRWAVWGHYGEDRAANELANESMVCRRTVHRWIESGLEMLAADLLHNVGKISSL